MSRSDRHTHYSFVDIERYLQGDMSPSEMHALEKAALQDPFLADAIEGYESADLTGMSNDLSGLRRQLAEPKTHTKIVDLPSRAPWTRIAAIVVVIAGVAAASWRLFFASTGALHQDAVATVAPIRNPVAQDHKIEKDTGLPAKSAVIASINQPKNTPQIVADKLVKEDAVEMVQDNSLKEAANAVAIQRQSTVLPGMDTVAVGNVLAENRIAVDQVLQGKIAGIAAMDARAKARAESERKLAEDALKKQVAMVSIAGKDSLANLVHLRGRSVAGNHQKNTLASEAATDVIRMKTSMINAANASTAALGGTTLSNLTVTGTSGSSAADMLRSVPNLTATGNLTMAAPERRFVKSDTLLFEDTRWKLGSDSPSYPFSDKLVVNPGPGVLEPDGGWEPFSRSFVTQLIGKDKESFAKGTQLIMEFTTDQSGRVKSASLHPRSLPGMEIVPEAMRKRAAELFLKSPRWKYHGIYQAAGLAVVFRW